MNQKIADELSRIAGAENITTDEPMDRHTSFKIGGPADYFAAPRTQEQITGLLSFCEREGLPYFLMGNGSNLLVGDEGFRGLIIQLWRNFSQITMNGNVITAQAGAMLSAVAKRAALEGLTGMEFASGIPGTIGGAAVMNAGAYGGEIKDVLLWAEVLTPEGDFIRMTPEELDLSYRHSIVFERGYIVLSACFCLKEGRREDILSGMEDLAQRRKSKQPLEFPSAGSTFKRPEGYFAGKLIQDAGLKGYTVGGAQVSEKHSGFVINRGGAEACEVAFLIRQVRKKVAARFGVLLEPEVRFLGFDPVDPADDVR